MAVDTGFITGPGQLSATAAVIAGAPAGQMRVTNISGLTAAVVGKHLLTQRSIHPGNNGYFLIATLVNPTTIDVVNGAAFIPDAGPIAAVVVTGLSNTWIVEPSGTDTKDTPNWQFVLDLGTGITANNPGLRVITKAGGPAPFYISYQISIADAQWTLEPKTGQGCTFLAGKPNGDPMDLLTSSDGIRLQNVSLAPDMFQTYQVAGSTDVVIQNTGAGRVKLATVPSSNFRAGTQGRWTGGGQSGLAPWDNFNCLALFRNRAILGSWKSGAVKSISAPVANEQTVETYSAIFTADDVGQLFTNYDSPDPTNNGQFPITVFVDATHIKILNAAGVVNAAPVNRWAIIPDPLPVSTVNFTAINTDFQSEFGDPIPLYSNDMIPSIANPFSTLDILPFLIAAPTPPTNSVDPNHEVQFVVIGGNTYWAPTGGFGVLCVGNVTMHGCNFLRAGHIQCAIRGNTNLGYALFLAPERPSTVFDFKDITFTDCGYSSTGGAISAIAVGNYQGSLSFVNSHLTLPTPCNNPGNGLIHLIFECGDFTFGFVEPEGTSLFPAGIQTGNPTSSALPGGVRQPPVCVISKCITDFSGTIAEAESAFEFVGSVDSNGDPDTSFLACVIRNCTMLGPIFLPIEAEGIANFAFIDNHIEGQPDTPCISISDFGPGTACYNGAISNNVFNQSATMFPIPTFNVLLDPGTKNVDVMNGVFANPLIPSPLATVLDLGAGDEQQGCIVSTNPAFSPF